MEMESFLLIHDESRSENDDELHRDQNHGDRIITLNHHPNHEVNHGDGIIPCLFEPNMCE